MGKRNSETGNRLVLKADNIIMREVTDTMNKGKNWWQRVNRELMTVLALALVLLVAAAGAQAGCPAANASVDTDQDGLSDQLECTGITFPVSGLVPYCGDSNGGPLGCLHPDIADLFVIIDRANPSLLPAENVLQYLTLVTGHEIAREDVGTLLEIPGTEPVQRALLISENTGPGAGGGYLGELPWGIPPNITIGSIYTRDILDFVLSKGGAEADAENYMKYVLAHEYGHGVKLAAKYNSRYNGYHVSIRDDVVMQENAVVSTKGKNAPTFYLPSEWGVDSEAAFKLK